jgi:hypothetical protein
MGYVWHCEAETTTPARQADPVNGIMKISLVTTPAPGPAMPVDLATAGFGEFLTVNARTTQGGYESPTTPSGLGICRVE